MSNPFYFSDYIKPLRQGMRFILLVTLRFLRIIFRGNRELSLLQLRYGQKFQFKKSFFFIWYQFENALWYSFEHIKKTTEAGVLILDLENLQPAPLKLTVYGFCQKKVFLIRFVPEVQLQTPLFYPDLRKPILLQSRIRPVSVNNLSVVSVNKASMGLAVPKINACFPAIMVRHSQPRFSHSSFNPTEFI